MSTIKFEKGKFYKTRDGKKVECVHTSLVRDDPLLFVLEGSGGYFTAHPNGIFYSRSQESSYDIISEWHEERVVWVYRDGYTGEVGMFTEYRPAIDWIGGPSGRHPQDSLTRVVIQDGHIDKE